MIAAKIETHVADAVRRLLAQYTDAPRMVGLVSALAAEVQRIEDAMYDLEAARSLFGNPEGAQLDRLGELIGVSRNGMSDATYLAVLKGAISENFSDGTGDTIVRAAANLFQAPAVFKKDVSSVRPWPGLAATPAISDPPWVPPPGAVMSTLAAPVMANASQSFFIQVADWPLFVPGGYIVLAPGQPTQEFFLFFSVSPPDIITPAGSPTQIYAHDVGEPVLYAAEVSDIPTVATSTPGELYTASRGEGDLAGSVALGLGSPALDPADYAIVQKMLVGSLPAGVGLFYLSLFSATRAFAPAGPQSWVTGWADVNDPTAGGLWADLLYNNLAL